MYADSVYKNMAFFDTVGDGTGTRSFNADFSAVAGFGRVIVPIDKSYAVSGFTLSFSWSEAIPTITDLQKFANLVLTNGINIVYSAGGTLVTVPEAPILSTAELITEASQFDIITQDVTGASGYTVNVSVVFGDLVVLTGTSGDYFSIELHDNFSTLTNFSGNLIIATCYAI